MYTPDSTLTMGDSSGTTGSAMIKRNTMCVRMWAVTGIRNIYACLVHESQECVVDLVRNLRYLDPVSPILLYNGGRDAGLLDQSFPFDRYGAVVHPKPRPLSWGVLHDFALDCMKFSLDNFDFDTLTVVDSDQLSVGAGYPLALGKYLASQQDIGLLGNAPLPLPPDTKIGPAAAAFQEIDLWRPFLQRFPEGEEKFVHWTFWPATVFTAEAARDLTQLFATDTQLQDIMRRTKIWATEEVILPTLVALLGYKIAANPCSYDYVKFRVPYTNQHIDTAISRPDVFWVHPVPRSYEDNLRNHIRTRFNHYEQPLGIAETATDSKSGTQPGLLLTWPILTRMKEIEGWLEEGEADLLIAATSRALSELPETGSVVEVGSYHGRSTVVLGSVLKALRSEAKVYAIDPHNGEMGALEQGIQVKSPSLGQFKRNIADAGLTGFVEVIQKYSVEVDWKQPISLLLIDGLHDYVNVARDFYHFEPWVVNGGYVAFHDYAEYYPGVKAFVNELLASGQYRKVQCAQSLMIVKKQTMAALPKRIEFQQQPDESRVRAVPARSHSRSQSNVAPASKAKRSPAVVAKGPMVSCIMPTHNRRRWIPQSIAYFLNQDYLSRELIILDDGSDPVADLVPADPRIRYMRLEEELTVGAKRNLACREATGEIIVHWDDDDWMAPRRLTYQVMNLRRERAEICGLDTPLFYDPSTDQAWRYVFPQGGRAWVYGATLSYTRTFWENNPFPDVSVGEDTLFIWSQRFPKILVLEDCTFYVSIIHPQNSSAKGTTGSRWHPYPSDSIRDILGEDLAFYQRDMEMQNSIK